MDKNDRTQMIKIKKTVLDIVKATVLKTARKFRKKTVPIKIIDLVSYEKGRIRER